MKRLTLLGLLIYVGALSLMAQSNPWIRHYDHHNNGLNEHVFDIRQDSLGVIWVSTYGGVFSFDSQQFEAHKESVVPPQPNQTWEPKTLLEKHFNHLAQTKQITKWILCSLTDRDGNTWIGTSNGLWLLSEKDYPFHLLDLGEEVLCLFQSTKGDVWMTTRSGCVCLLDDSLHPVRYLTEQGDWSDRKVNCGWVVMNIMESNNDCLWLSARGSGLLKLQQRGSDIRNGFQITYIKGNDTMNGGLHALDNVYAACMDSQERIWTASLKTGLGVVSNQSPNIPGDIVHFNTLLKRSNQEPLSDRFRCFLPLYADDWLVGSDDGLYYIKPSTWHNNKPGTVKVLPPEKINDSNKNRSIQNLLCDHHGRIYAGTSGYGLVAYNPTNDISNLTISHVFSKEDDNLPSNVICSTAEDNSKVWGFCDSGLFFLSPDEQKSQQQALTVANILNGSASAWPTMSIGNALLLKDGRMLKGTHQGLIWFYADSVGNRQSRHPILLKAQYHAEQKDTSFVVGDTLTLPKGTSDFSLYCSVLDYNRLADVIYAYRVSNVDTVWSYTSEPTIDFSKLPSGYSDITIRATNGNGVWSSNERHITVYIESEHNWATWLIIAMVVLYAVTVYFLYRRRSQKKDTVESVPNALKPILEDVPTKDVVEEQFRNEVLEHIKKHLNDSEFGTDQLAKELGISKTTLLSKIKSTYGTVPSEVISRVRIQAATELLEKTELTISEIAYRTGFNDPKYFSRVYKKITGKSPSEIRNKGIKN